MRHHLRSVRLALGYTLHTYATGRYDHYGKSQIGYELFAPRARKPLFAGEDFYAAPGKSEDSDACVAALLVFLTLRPGDTDADYFASYTPEQMAFARGDAEQVALIAYEIEEHGGRFAGTRPRKGWAA